MKFDIGSMSVKDNRAYSALRDWVCRQPVAFGDFPVTVYVDSSCDFCAVEFVTRPFEHKSKAHHYMDIVVSPYLPVVVPFWIFRRRVFNLLSRC